MLMILSGCTYQLAHIFPETYLLDSYINQPSIKDNVESGEIKFSKEDAELCHNIGVSPLGAKALYIFDKSNCEKLKECMDFYDDFDKEYQKLVSKDDFYIYYYFRSMFENDLYIQSLLKEEKEYLNKLNKPEFYEKVNYYESICGNRRKTLLYQLLNRIESKRSTGEKEDFSKLLKSYKRISSDVFLKYYLDHKKRNVDLSKSEVILVETNFSVTFDKGARTQYTDGYWRIADEDYIPKIRSLNNDYVNNEEGEMIYGDSLPFYEVFKIESAVFSGRGGILYRGTDRVIDYYFFFTPYSYQNRKTRNSFLEMDTGIYMSEDKAKAICGYPSLKIAYLVEIDYDQHGVKYIGNKITSAKIGRNVQTERKYHYIFVKSITPLLLYKGNLALTYNGDIFCKNSK